MKVQNAQVVEINQGEQQDLLDGLGRLTRKSLAVIAKAVTAKKPCGTCWNGAPKKKNADGRCLTCDGTGEVDDFERNRWATEQILGRKLPMPKAVEMRVNDNRDKEELARAFRALKKPQIEALLSEFDERIENLSRMDKKLIPMEEAADGVTDA